MSITVHVYNTPTAPEHLYKDLSTVISPEGGYTGDVRGEISVDAPVILIQATILTGNYVKIPEFGRYYWITDRNIERTDLTELTLRSDPLMSFASQIRQLPIEVTRCTKQAIEGSESGYNSMIHDAQIVTSCQRTFREFPFTLSGSVNRMVLNYPGTEYILAVIG